MDLFEEEVETKKISEPRKKVLIALVICILLLVFLLMLMSSIKKSKPKSLTLSVDGNDIKITNNMLITDETGSNTYISLKQLSKTLGYDYIEGEYLKQEEEESSNETTKCYLQGTKQIIGFEENSKKIYKTSLGASLDFQYLKLNNNIIKRENDLYIALEDLNVGCNVIFNYSEEKNKIEINTIDNMLKIYKSDLAQHSISISESNFNNQKTILYGMIIATDSSGKFGLLDTKYNQIIGFIYDTMDFDEVTQNFIVSNNKKYGVINKEGKIVIKLTYNEMEIINNTPVYYKVKSSNNKYGVIDEDGNIIVNREYDKIGISNRNLNNDILIIKNIGDNGLTGIVVCKDNKYGIVNIKNKKEIIQCTLDEIYYKELESGELEYYIKKDDIEETLNNYLIDLNTTVVNF